MALRFRRRIRLMPGVHLNVGTRGLSVSAGIRGASITAGARGVYANAGVPGTGLSFRERVSGRSPTSRPSERRSSSPSALVSPNQSQGLPVVLRLRDDGQVKIESEDGQPLTQRQLKLLRDEKSDVIQRWLEDGVAKLNADYVACVNVHIETPNPSSPRWQTFPPFTEEKASPPEPRKVGLLDRLLLRRRRIEAENIRLRQVYNEALAGWCTRARAYLQARDEWASLVHRISAGDMASMESVLAKALSAIAWPRETNVSLDFGHDSSTMELDVDLPEIEDMPTRIASPARGLRVNFKSRTEAEIRRDYLRLVHGTVFRVAGEAFANLPTLEQVTVSAFTQRKDRATGHEADDYVLSVSIHRRDWSCFNFENLQDIDPVEALGKFEIVRSCDRRGHLEAIRPLIHHTALSSTH